MRRADEQESLLQARGRNLLRQRVITVQFWKPEFLISFMMFLARQYMCKGSAGKCHEARTLSSYSLSSFFIRITKFKVVYRQINSCIHGIEGECVVSY